MPADLGDWGLLSIADILDVDLIRKSELSSNMFISLNDMEVPLLPCEPTYILRYVQLLIQNAKYEAEHRTSHLEELNASRCVKLKRSLAASELIRAKLSGAIESFASTVEHEDSQPSILQTIVLLGSLVCSDNGLFSEALIEGTEAMASRSVDSFRNMSISVDVIQSFKSQANLNSFSKNQRVRLLCAEFSLALRCGRLSGILNCLLHKATEERLEGTYSPPALEHSVSYIKAKSSCFLTRVCELPFFVRSTQLYCRPSDESLFVCCENKGYVFAQLGMMGTRFRSKEEFEFVSEKSAKIIFCNKEELYFAQRSSFVTGTVCYILQKRNRLTDKILAKSKIIFHFDSSSVATRDVVFDIHDSTLTSLICTECTRASNSKCQLFQMELDSIFINEEINIHLAAQQYTLKRGFGCWCPEKKCYYFTKGSALSVGKVTLKESFHPFTLEMWVYPCNASDSQIVLSLGDKSVDEILVEIEPTPEGVLWKGGSRTPHLGTSFVAFLVPGKLAFCHRWWHIALVFRGNLWELWVNDAIVARAPALVSPEAMSDVECCLGKSFVGCLAEVRIWNDCRTAAQFSRDSRRSLTNIDPALIGYYPLDEGEGDVISDYSSNGCHTLLHYGHAKWAAVGQFPVAAPEEARSIDDFAPIAWRESSGNLFLSTCPGYISIAVPTDGPSVMICEYTTHDLRLVFQARIELFPGTLLKGFTYKSSRHSLVCFASTGENPKHLLIWELHQQHYLPFLKKERYDSIWECGKDLLLQCAAYAKLIVGAERCLVDQLSWSIQAPKLVVDTREGVLSSLLRLIHEVLHDHKDLEYARQLCALLHANLLCRIENQDVGIRNEIGDAFPDGASLIKAAGCVNQASTARIDLLRLSFQESLFETGLLSMTCRCLLSEKGCLSFIKSQAGRWRLTDKEDMLFRCLLKHYESLQASSLLISNTENAQLFCSSLMFEEVCQVDRWLNGHQSAVAAVRRTSYCLEVFQEILLAKAVEKAHGECSNFASFYAKLFLRTCERVMEFSWKALRKKPELYESGLTGCLEASVVGALLPSFTVAIPLLHTSVQASCVNSLKNCREALFSLSRTLPQNERLLYELGVALTSSLSRIGCSLLMSSDVVTAQVDTKYLNLLWGGVLKSGSERDAVIKNLQQGVGSISKVVDELHREDQGALIILRDDRLVMLERLMMAAFCSLLMTTEALRNATKESLAPMYRYVHNMRAWVLSKRQESPDTLDVLEHRAMFLARFEPICNSRTETTSRVKTAFKNANPQRRWRRYFQSWKSLRVLKTKMPQRRDIEVGDTGGVISEFLQDNNVDRENVDSLVLQQVQRSQYRISGMLLLRQLIEEARFSSSLARVVLPLVSKVFTGWHYADDVQCCSKEDFLRLHSGFFQILDLVVNCQSDVKSAAHSLWGDVLLALLTSELRVVDFQRIRGDVADALCSLWKFENRVTAGLPRLNGTVPESLRNTMLSASNAAPSLVVGRSGCTIRGLGGRGSCIGPCEWSLGRKSTCYYFEVLIIDLYPRGSCCVGVGPPDYSISRLPGWDSESYALHTEDGTLYEGSTLGRPVGSTFGVGDVIGCGWNTENKQVFWTKNGKHIVVTVQASQTQFYPLIGLCGKGLVKVNFGAEPFLFDKPPNFRPCKRNFGENAWDVFRVFSLRAALGLVDWCNGPRETGDSSDTFQRLKAVVEQCLECICVELERTLPFLPVSNLFILSLCAHLTTLGKIFVSVRSETMLPAVQRVVRTLQRSTHHVLRSLTCSSVLRCTLLSSWFTFMNLISPSAVSEEVQFPCFLDTLIALSRELESAILQRSPTTMWECRMTVESWTALAFLHRLNSETPEHLWREELHVWIMKSLESPKDKADTFLALRILHGGARLAVSGDKIVIQKAKHTTMTATLVDYSLEDGTCDVIEKEEKRVTVSLRQANIIVNDKDTLFPEADNKFHLEQVKQVVRMAQRQWMNDFNNTSCSSPEVSPLNAALQCRVLAIVWRCIGKSFIATPADFLPFLARLCETSEICSDERQLMIQEKLVIEYCLHRRMPCGALSMTPNSAILVSGATESTISPAIVSSMASGTPGDGNAPGNNLMVGNCNRFTGDDNGDASVNTRELRTRLAQELSMRGYNLDLCFLALDETNNDLHAALQLLGDHHGDFMSTRRRTSSSSIEEEEISSDGNAEMDAGEYDVVLFPAESDEDESDDDDDDDDDRIEDYVSVDQSDLLSDGIRFLGGYVCVTSDRSFGREFTIDFQLYLFDVSVTQVVLYQHTASNLRFIARVLGSALHCGWMQESDELGAHLCRAPLDGTDTLRWLRVTFVQSGTGIALYKSGTLNDEGTGLYAGGLLDRNLCIGGHEDGTDTRLNGGIRDVRLFDAALSAEDVMRLPALSPRDLRVRRALSLECGRDAIAAASVGAVAAHASVGVVGTVTWFEQPATDCRGGDGCQQEVDLTTQNDEGGVFTIDTASEADSFTAAWRKRKDQRREQLLAALARLDRQLAARYAVAVLSRMLLDAPEYGARLQQAQARRLVRLAVASHDEELQRSLEDALRHLAVMTETPVIPRGVEVASSGNRSEPNSAVVTEKSASAVTMLTYAVEELVDMVQHEQETLVFESAHPFKLASETAHEVYVPSQRSYELHFDPRCSSGSMLVTFYADHTLSTVIAQAPGYSLTSLAIHATRFFFDVRMDASGPQWGYRVVVLYDFAIPRVAARLLRATLSSLQSSGDLSRVPFFSSCECLDALANASRANVSSTRRLLLSCLMDLFLYAPECAEAMPQMARMHDLRRMSERLFRRTAGSQHFQSRFVQVVSEFYVAFKDAEHSWRVQTDERARVCEETYDAAADADRFLLKRQEQRTLYKRREGLRIALEKARHPESLRIDVNTNKTILVWSEQSESAVVADIPLSAGRWYFELRMMATGDVSIGVLPSCVRQWGDLPVPETHITFNGKTGTFYGVKDTGIEPRRIWKGKDYVGVVMDGTHKTCSFFVNGKETGIVFPFGANESEAATAAGSRIQDEQEFSYYPFIVFEEEEGVTINFGGAHFEYEPPRNSFPFDPANLALGTLIPYNQLRAFHDLATHIVSGGRITLPPFFYEEANPFEHSTERSGPPHVSVHSTDGVQVNMLLVRNTSSRFVTVRANCRVLGGKWYYEVTLRSQGLMQIGWSAAPHALSSSAVSAPDSGDAPVAEGSVGDTATSWAVDLFRRVKWHDGHSRMLTASRRWAVGDVIGCALDLVEGKMIFMCNGCLLCDAGICDSTFTGLSTSLSYEPAVSLRAGNEVLFNFGSSSFKYKPEGFCALGVPDSWNERIDAFYTTRSPSTTLLRLRALRNMWRTVDHQSTAEALQFYQIVVDAVQQCCRRQNKSFAQLTEDACREIFREGGIPVQKGWEAYRVLGAFLRVAQNVIPFLHIDTRHPNISTRLFLACRTLIYSSLRNEMTDNILRETNVRAEHFRVSINRLKARTNKGSWMSTVFGQTFSLVADQPPRIFRTNRRFWSVVFLGEGSEDVGGPFREHVGEMCRELMSRTLPLFVPTANNVHNTGTYRDAFVPAASATSEVELSAFLFVGQLMGGALRSNEPLGLFLPPLVWKFLCFNPIVESDLDDVDRICLQCIREFRTLKTHVDSSEMFDEVFDSETFTTRLSDGSVRELFPGGTAARVSFDRCEEYADALSAARCGEFSLQLAKLREGLLNVVPEIVLCLLTPAELEQRVCGKPDYAVAELREGAVYEGLTSDDRRVQFLWKALEEATALQRRLFLRFVSGRDRMPVKLRVLPLSTAGDADSMLPRAATCFYAIELPDYSTLEVTKAKLYYSIENCADIDTDFNPREVDENDAPQLVVGLEETRQEEVDSATLSE